MLLIIILSSVHILLSVVMLYLFINKFILPGFLVVSIIACLLILLYAIDCKSMNK